MIKKQSCSKDVRKLSISHRVVDEWNRLPSSVVESASLSIFKARLDKYIGTSVVASDQKESQTSVIFNLYV